MTNRNDIHSPTNLDPEDYTAVGYFDNGYTNSESETSNRLRLRGLLAESETARYGNGARCDHCGAHIRYVVVFHHLPTGDHIAVGETCADGRMTYSKAEFDRLRKAAALDRQQQRLLTAWNEFKAANADVDWDGLAASENSFVMDVLAKGRRYGNLSPRQVEAIQQAVVRDAEYAARKAVEASQPKVDVPEGRMVIEGEVLSMKTETTYFGYRQQCITKMLVLVTTDAGSYKVWGTMPSALSVEKGDTVRFTATVERSHKDSAFGFFKRPTKGEVLAPASV